MVSHAQVMNMLRRNVDYNDMVGSTNGAGAGYIGGYSGGCAACLGAGCMGCAMGNGYIGGAYKSKGLRKCAKVGVGAKGRKRCLKYEPSSVFCEAYSTKPGGKKRCAKYGLRANQLMLSDESMLGQGYIGGFKGQRAALAHCAYPINPLTGRPIKSKANKQAHINCILDTLESDAITVAQNDDWVDARDRRRAMAALRKGALPKGVKYTKADYEKVYKHDRPVRANKGRGCAGMKNPMMQEYCHFRSSLSQKAKANGQHISQAQISAAWSQHKEQLARHVV